MFRRAYERLPHIKNETERLFNKVQVFQFLTLLTFGIAIFLREFLSNHPLLKDV